MKTTPNACVYILRLRSGNLYVGCTKDLPKRYHDHLHGRACQTTRKDPPVAIVYQEAFEDFGEARIREAQIKGWSRAKKEALVAGDYQKAAFPGQTDRQISALESGLNHDVIYRSRQKDRGTSDSDIKRGLVHHLLVGAVHVLPRAELMTRNKIIV
jgi:putative endonuclease